MKRIRPFQLVGFLMVLTLVLAIAAAPARAAKPFMMGGTAKKVKPAEAAAETAPLPETITPESVDGLIAVMSDEQVRRLLIEQLKKEAQRESAPAAEPKPTGLAGFIHRTKEMINFLRARIEFLRSGVSVDAREQAPGIFTYLGTGEKGTNPYRTIFTVVAVFAAGFLVDGLFRRYTRAARRRIEAGPTPGWIARIGALSLRAVLELLSMVVFAVAVLALFYFFLDRTTPQRVLVATYLAAVLIVRAAFLVSHFLLAPGVPGLRVLPVGDATALYLHRWLTAIVVVVSFGLLTCGIFRLAGTSEGDYFKMVTLVGLVPVLMFVWMILQKRKDVARALAEGLPGNSLGVRLAGYWHHGAIFVVILIYAFSTLQRLLYGSAQGVGVKTLGLIALYFLLDWLLRQALNVAFGLAERPEELTNRFSATASASPAADPEPPVPTAAAEQGDDLDEGKPEAPRPKAPVYRLEFDRIKHVLRVGLRVALAGTVFFWIMGVWGLELPVGAAVVDGAFDILITVLICYVAWELINAAIQRKLRQEMPDSDDDMEEGGVGGSRVGTLLLLLRKFMLIVMVVMVTMIVLSRLGVNIGPLIAGAGVIGLAIGFGAQTLVKDIISGLFFLMDDAFRVGDYVEIGASKGMVEQISIRSFKLRHPRGMVNTIPFGDVKTVTNFSRDYIITKLDFRVRYDADVEKIRKIIKKKVYEKIRDNPELGPKLLDAIKSQGVREMDDSAMLMRVKYKTIPGEQFAIRKEVYRLMQEAFKNEGIEFAHRNVTVYMPPEVQEALATGDAAAKQAVAQAGAAAAATVQAEEEAAQKAAESKGKKK